MKKLLLAFALVVGSAGVSQAQSVWDLLKPAPTCMEMRAEIIERGWPKDPLEADARTIAALGRMLEIAIRTHQHQECDFTSLSFLTAAFGYVHGTETALAAAALTDDDLATTRTKLGMAE